MTLDDLHDAILTTIDVDMARSTITLVFRPMQFAGRPGSFLVIAHAWTRFTLPREEPWGRGGHDNVNEVRGPFAIGRALWRLEIELQSGDLLELHASSFTAGPDLHALRSLEETGSVPPREPAR